MRLIRITIVAILTSVAAGCATQYSSERGTWQRQPVNRPTVKPVIVEPERPVILPSTTTAPAEPIQSLPAAVALRKQAMAARASGDYQRAIGLLERALRISPRDPETFMALAQNNLAMDQPAEAMQLARKGLSLNPTATQRASLQTIVTQIENLQ